MHYNLQAYIVPNKLINLKIKNLIWFLIRATSNLNILDFIKFSEFLIQ